MRSRVGLGRRQSNADRTSIELTYEWHSSQLRNFHFSRATARKRPLRFLSQRMLRYRVVFGNFTIIRQATRNLFIYLKFVVACYFSVTRLMGQYLTRLMLFVNITKSN